MPLNGLVKAKGAIVIHLAMLIASFFVYPAPPIQQSGSAPFNEAAGSSHPETLQILTYLRMMHSWFITSHIIRRYTQSEENDLLHMLLKAGEIWGYLMIICWLQFYLMNWKVVESAGEKTH